MKTIPFPCLLLLLGGCSSIERGVVIGKGQGVNSTTAVSADYYWVDVRGEADGAPKTERVPLFRADWDRFKKGDRIAPHDFDMLGAARALGGSVKKIARVKGPPQAKPATPAPTPPRASAPKRAANPTPRPPRESASETPASEEARFRNLEARANEDAAVRAAKFNIHNARTDAEQTAAFQEYRRALFQKMRELDPSLKERIDAAETP